LGHFLLQKQERDQTACTSECQFGDNCMIAK